MLEVQKLNLQQTKEKLKEKAIDDQEFFVVEMDGHEESKENNVKSNVFQIAAESPTDLIVSLEQNTWPIKRVQSLEEEESP